MADLAACLGRRRRRRRHRAGHRPGRRHDDTVGRSRRHPAGGRGPAFRTESPEAVASATRTGEQHSPPVTDQVTRHVLAARSLGDGTRETVLHLTPDHLGPVTVTLQVQGSDVRLDLAANDAALAALNADLGELRDGLSASGLELTDVTLRPDDDGSQQQQPGALAGPGRPGRRTPGRQAGPGGDGRATEEGPTAGPAGRARRRAPTPAPGPERSTETDETGRRQDPAGHPGLSRRTAARRTGQHRETLGKEHHGRHLRQPPR